MHSKAFILPALFLYQSCNYYTDNTANSVNSLSLVAGNKSFDANPYKKIHDIPLPSGFTRVNTEANSFGKWLQDVKLKKDKKVYLFNGLPKHNQAAQFAVLDISIGKRDLQQCADAIIRLRAEYLFDLKAYRAIHFKDNNGTSYRFEKPYTRQNLVLYLQQVFGMCGSASLANQLYKKPIKTIQPGDVIIRGGFPGHAVIVMDVATNPEGKKIYLLAQSYMPAQDIHLLNNPINDNRSPWYELNDHELIQTPEYTFRKEELKGW